ncbi:hypothetical protein BDV30DRAFT_216815 [Aspergillus minisclerotigenes]|uniref:Uncharacterized protein n=1 Tax=Aspergillus minisclerotigenes TaxID=656917 RepID=A0A5N6ITP8_9EURO|nr:hypothetical protein BDV30DRAFT_216815 [Aspergillus minisclerotigenes]
MSDKSSPDNQSTHVYTGSHPGQIPSPLPRQRRLVWFQWLPIYHLQLETAHCLPTSQT